MERQSRNFQPSSSYRKFQVILASPNRYFTVKTVVGCPCSCSGEWREMKSERKNRGGDLTGFFAATFSLPRHHQPVYSRPSPQKNLAVHRLRHHFELAKIFHLRMLIMLPRQQRSLAGKYHVYFVSNILYAAAINLELSRECCIFYVSLAISNSVLKFLRV